MSILPEHNRMRYLKFLLLFETVLVDMETTLKF